MQNYNLKLKIKSLKLPLGKYVVLGGSALELYGIRKSRDIDITVTKSVYQKFKLQGFKETKKPSGIKILTRGNYEVGLAWTCGNYKPSTRHLIKTAKIIDGIPVVDLKEIIKYKKELNRTKDSKDIKLIQDYLKRSN